MAQAGSSSYALLTDGTTIEIRPARPEDFDAVRDMHAKMSPENLYLRFFGLSRSAAEGEARRVCREPAPDHGALAADLASLRDILLRVSQLADDPPQVAELELSPVVARPDGALAVDGRVRIQAAEPADAYLRQLR